MKSPLLSNIVCSYYSHNQELFNSFDKNSGIPILLIQTLKTNSSFWFFAQKVDQLRCLLLNGITLE